MKKGASHRLLGWFSDECCVKNTHDKTARGLPQDAACLRLIALDFLMQIQHVTYNHLGNLTSDQITTPQLYITAASEFEGIPA